MPSGLSDFRSLPGAVLSCAAKKVPKECGIGGSDGSAASGGRSDLSEWQRSVNEEAALPATRTPGTATGKDLSDCSRNQSHLPYVPLQARIAVG